MTASLASDIGTGIEPIRRLLLSPLSMPDWNPAFVTVSGPASAVTGTRYALVAIRGLTGSFQYDTISAERIDMRWSVPGMEEICTWELISLDRNVTRVVHSVSRSGPLGLVLHGSLATLPALRLERLAMRLAPLESSGGKIRPTLTPS